MENIKKIYINNKKIYSFQAEDELLKYIQDVKTILISMNAESIINSNQRFINIINQNIAFADGVGAVMALKNRGLSAVKIAGVELWLKIIERNLDKSFYLIGSTSKVIKITKQKLKIDFKDINILGYHNGYFNEEEFLNIEKDILDKKPDIIFIALGQPKQEFIAQNLYKKHNALYMGIGGSFDIYSGMKKRSPKIFIDLNLEWLYRLFKEPTRLGRQLKLIKFLFLFIRRRGKIS